MARQRSNTWSIVTIIVALVLGVVVLPYQYKPWAPRFLRNTSVHFGLDLAGGTQLDFRISERELAQQVRDLETELQGLRGSGLSDRQNSLQEQIRVLKDQQSNIVERIRTVLERRINALGVSEATITPSYVGNEKHLLVECPGVVDVQECIATVGKTIQLEFKEEADEATEEFEDEVRERLDIAYDRIVSSGETLSVVGQDLSDELGINYHETFHYFQNQLPDGLEDVWELTPEDGVQKYEGTQVTLRQTDSGQIEPVEETTLFLLESLGPRSATGRIIRDRSEAFEIIANEDTSAKHSSYANEGIDTKSSPAVAQAIRTMEAATMRSVQTATGVVSAIFLRSYSPGIETMEASHILIAYAGALRANEAVTRSKEEAAAVAAQALERARSGENFAALARELSDGPSGEDGGSLGEFNRQTMTPAFSEAAFALATDGISDVVETDFGYHIIYADRGASVNPDTATYDEVVFRGENAQLRADAAIARIEANGVVVEEEQTHVRMVVFSLQPTGWQDTPLDGKHFRSASVTLDPNTGFPIVQITFDEKGGELFADLTERNIGKPIAIFVGGNIVSAPTVQSKITGGTAIITGSRNFDEAKFLADDLNTGAIPAPIFLTGQRTVEATLGAQALQTSLKAALVGIAILMIYMILVYRLLGVIASLALSVYAFLFLAMLKLPLFLVSSQYIVLTLAGMAGIILSIGMAVDANVLIFERMKEEMKKGKMLKTAANTGFERAWPSIRDGNVSTFITCSILFLIGTSIVRGFAVTLGLGVIISMFTAIVITRWLLTHVANTSLAHQRKLFCG